MEISRVQSQFGTFMGEIRYDGNKTIIKKPAQITLQASTLDKRAVKTLITAIPDESVTLTGSLLIARPSKDHLKIYREARALLAGNGKNN